MGKGGLSGAGMFIGALAGLATGGLAWAPVLTGLAVGGALGQAGDSSIAGNRERHTAEGQAREQKRLQEKQEKIALEQRKAQIDAQRIGAGASGAASTVGTSTAGLSGSIGSTQTLG